MKSIVFCFFLVCLLALPRVALADPRPNRNTQESILVGSRERRYLLHVPRSYAEGTAVPLVVVFHGGNDSASDMQKLSQFNLVSAESNFIVAYPQADDEHWNDGRIPDGKAAGEPDDVTFVARLVAKISGLYTIDPHRIYALGYSNGGMMVLRAACELPGLFAGAATVAASFPRSLSRTCEPQEPISLLMINGTEDEVVPWFGIDPRRRNAGTGLFLAAEETAQFWAKRASCGSRPVGKQVTDLDVKGIPFAEEYRFQSCRPGIEVVVYALIGLGHEWPAPNLSRFAELVTERALSTQLNDFQVPNLIWKFLSRQSRPDVRR